MSVTRDPLVGGAALAIAALLMAGCSAPAEKPPVEKIQQSASASPSPTPTATAEAGTRGAPLAVGEMRRLSSKSMWSVGASAPSVVGAGYTVLPLHLELDWDAAKAQGMPDGEGVDPMGSLTIEYVTTGGRSYDWDEIGVLEVTNRLADVGMLYPPAASVDANYVVTLPDAEIPGGVWKVTNSNGDSLFLASS